jgi:hypothetical protein
MKISSSKRNILIAPLLVATSIVSAGLSLMAVPQVAQADPPPWSQGGNRDRDRYDSPPPPPPLREGRPPQWNDGPPPPRPYNQSRWQDNNYYDYPQPVYRRRVVPRFNINIGF